VKRDLPPETYVLGTLACACGVFGLWLFALRLRVYGAGMLVACMLVASAAEQFARRRR
jgi:hypothetical protein